MPIEKWFPKVIAVLAGGLLAACSEATIDPGPGTSRKDLTEVSLEEWAAELGAIKDLTWVDKQRFGDIYVAIGDGHGQGDTAICFWLSNMTEARINKSSVKVQLVSGSPPGERKPIDLRYLKNPQAVWQFPSGYIYWFPLKEVEHVDLEIICRKESQETQTVAGQVTAQDGFQLDGLSFSTSGP